jgi:hypothetical protein
MEEGDPETYAPVVAWSSVRLFLILAMTLNWLTCSIDFSSAFVQAMLDEPVWIHLSPRLLIRERLINLPPIGQELVWSIGGSASVV